MMSSFFRRTAVPEDEHFDDFVFFGVVTFVVTPSPMLYRWGFYGQTPHSSIFHLPSMKVCKSVLLPRQVRSLSLGFP